MTTRTFYGTMSGQPAASAGQMYFSSWVPDAKIPAGHRRTVRRTVDHAAARMGLGHVRIRYFGPAVNGGDFWGIAPDADMVPAGVAPDDQPMTIGLNASLRGEAVSAVIAHELGHLAQRRRGHVHGDPERDADRYALAVLGAG